MYSEKQTGRDVSLVTRHPVTCQWAQREQSSRMGGCRVCEDETFPERSGTWPAGLCRVDQGPRLYGQGQGMNKVMGSSRISQAGQGIN